MMKTAYRILIGSQPLRRYGTTGRIGWLERDPFGNAINPVMDWATRDDALQFVASHRVFCAGCRVVEVAK